jgi:Secretion system C-terminal sorting domain
MFKRIFLFLAAISLGSLSAQNFIGRINPFPSISHKLSVSNDTLKILAVMVNFQEDKDDATFGNGKFGSIYSKDYGLSILDPLPHDKSYFEAHLLFAKNYFSKVSGGKQNISYHILPDTFSVSKTMRNYSPLPKSDDFISVADFSREVWTKAAQIYPDFDFKDYDIFMIFHAGAGREFSLPGSIGDERDLPSLYLSFDALKKIYGQNFTGFPVSSNTFNITNSMIMPETENRELSSLNGTSLIEISINGLLVSSIASYLGLPDLFDTETGKSAIGRFGLMDGQAIFAYNGLFPPQPSAWEKLYLGWANPVSVNPGNFNINLAADLAASGNDTTILKVPINSSEYYLLENRIRDTHKDGAIVKYVLGGDTLTKSFEKDATGFYSFETDSVDGVVIDVDEYDWALPGNGIVIWHVDDNIINSKIGDDKINADKQHRGVSVIEADGIQDIGEEFQTIFGDVVIGEGEPKDFWYASNDANFYENKFGKDTRPSSTTNSGANSLITISNFSDISNKMNFKISYGDSLIVPKFSKYLALSSADNHLTNFQNNNFALLNGSDLFIIDNNGSKIDSIMNFSKFKPASVLSNNTNYLIGAFNSTLYFYLNDNSTCKLDTVNVGEEITSPPVIINNSNQYKILVGTVNGKILKYSIGSLQDSPQLLSSITVSSNSIKKIAADNDYYSFITTSELMDKDGNSFQFSSSDSHDLVLTKDKSGNYISILNLNDRIYLISNGKEITDFPYQVTTSFSLADLKQDGENYLIFTNGNKVEAKNLNGANADNFPFEDPLEIGFAGTPLTVDFSGDKNSEIIAATKDGRIFAIDGGSGKVVDGFPISMGTELSSTPSIFEDNGKLSIAVLNNQNNFSAWNIGAAEGTIFWSEENGNNFNSSFIGTANNSNHINEFFPKDRAYNYPNPVYDNETNIHYYVSENSKINIKIFDLVGDYVTELNDNARGGLDNETVWKVNDIQSGVYLARIEAVGSSGKTESNIIKIVIIK